MKYFTVNPSLRLKISSTSDGEQIKWYKDNCYIKADTKGYESIAEALASEFLKYIRGISYTDYSLCEIMEGNEKYLGCYSYNINTVDCELISVYRLLQMYISDLDNVLYGLDGYELYDYICENLEDITQIGIQEYINQIITIDYILCNTDRHLNNIFVLYNKVEDYYSLAPILDNGASLMSDVNRFPLDFTYNQMLEKLSCKPFLSDFDKQISLTDDYILHIRIDDFFSDLDNKYVEFKSDEFERAKLILKGRLKETYGKLWMKC